MPRQRTDPRRRFRAVAITIGFDRSNMSDLSRNRSGIFMHRRGFALGEISNCPRGMSNLDYWYYRGGMGDTLGGFGGRR